MKEQIKDFCKSNSIFLKLLAIFTLSIFSAVLMSLFIFISITEKSMIDNYLNSHQKIVFDISENYNSIYQSSMDIINKVTDSNATHNFMALKADDSQKSREVSYAMNKLMKSTIALHGPVKTNVLLYSDEQAYYAYGDTRLLEHDQLQSQIVPLVKEANLSFHILDHGLSSSTQNNAQVVAVKSFKNAITQKENYIILSYSLDDIENIYKKFLDTPEISVFLNMKNKTVLSNTNGPYAYKDYKEGSFYINEQTLLLPNADFITVINRSNLINDVYRVKTLIISLTILIFALSTILYRVVRNITNPIYELASELGNTGSHKIEKISIKGSHEINVLVNAYNKMIDKITTYIDNIITLEKKKQDSDLKALLRQIDPHFIYNTLTSIRFLIVNNQAELANVALQDFIILLQSMTEFNNDKILLEDEIELLKHYTRLQKLRFGSAVVVNWNVSDDVRQVTIPKMILQPFIENALFHGFDGTSGIITISCFALDGNLKIEVMDNGKGITKEKLSSIEESLNQDKLTQNIGIANVHQRIQLEFGDIYGVSIHSQEGLGTIISIILPLT